MKPNFPLRTLLRTAALAVLAVGLGLWLATGAHRGWTQTSVVEMKRDEITGLDYPVRRAAFVAGVEIPALALVVAAGLFGASQLARRSPPATPSTPA